MRKIVLSSLTPALLILLTGCTTPLASAAAKGDINTVKDLLDKGTIDRQRMTLIEGAK